MASKLSFSMILCIFSIWVVNGADHAPAPSVDCSSVIISMSDCLSFVTNGSTVTEPKKTCCSGLEHVVKTFPACLCEVFKTSAKLGVALNLTKAASLPEACKVTAPSVSSCGLSVAPAHAPAPGAIHSPPPSPSTPATPPPSSDHEEHSPPHSGGNSASALFPISAASILLCLLVAVFSGF
ncbi:hypothetical protein TanjilG_14881 [Lupinus angustifolius]|uniref:Bifunctional inhibitor/plant lipid transfer protein/seed storage helical domain-containing protein n=1 Tax=Lupinus angustifolius TaxID=3871 RepID=A0A1J7H340_LUPAN|nr:PREDICTED: non-specific lipid-transfer protein-like protein At5g64080 [Lupinus angustifolius]OIV96204.1 hypothetical protein TanjilG_14881 [Lupinus angustifolius]